ncbi:hypothetical protein D3C72_1220670 [compost metagenome]
MHHGVDLVLAQRHQCRAQPDLLGLEVLFRQAVGGQHAQHRHARGRAALAHGNALAAQVRHRAGGVGATYHHMHRFRVEAAHGAQRRMRTVGGEHALALVGLQRDIGLRQRHRNLAGAQQPQVFLAAVRDQRYRAHLGTFDQRPCKAQVLAVLGAGGDGIALVGPRQPGADIGVRGSQLLLDHRALRRRSVFLYGLDHLAHRIQDSRGAGRRIGGNGGGFGRAVAGRQHADPALAFALVQRRAVRADDVAGLVAAAGDAGDAARARAQRRHQPGHAGRVPGAEVVVAQQFQFRIEVHHAAGFTGRGLGVCLRAAPVQAGQFHRARRQRLRQPLVDAGADAVGGRAAAAACQPGAGHQGNEEGEEGAAHVSLRSAATPAAWSARRRSSGRRRTRRPAA